MTDSEARKPVFTRKRLIAGAVGLLLVLTVVLLCFGVFGGDPMEPVKVTLLRFDQSRDGKATMAVVRLENRSKETVVLCSIDKLETLRGHFIARDGTNSLELPITDGMAVTPDGTNLAPHSVSTNRILLQWTEAWAGSQSLALYCRANGQVSSAEHASFGAGFARP